MPNFSERIKEILHLKGPIPKAIAKELQLDHHLLREIDTNFKLLATDLQIWSFFETIDSDLTNPELIETDRLPFHAPVTSIKSALLNLRHEVVYPLLSNHAQCASFEGNNAQTKTSYLGELAHAVKKACELSQSKHAEMYLENKVMVEINGFYEGTVLPNETEPPPIRVWSTSRSLGDFKKFGPARLLEDRLAEVTVAPRDTQHIRHHSRAASLLPDKPRESRPSSSIPTFNNPFEHLKSSSKPHTKHGKKSRKAKNKESAPPSSGPLAHASTDPDVAASRGSLASSNAGPSSPIIEEFGETQPPDALGITTPSLPAHPVVVEPPRDGSISINGMHQSRRHSEMPAQPFLLGPNVIHESSSRRRRGSESAINPASQITFSKPNFSNQRLVWVHVPFNNPSVSKFTQRFISLFEQSANLNAFFAYLRSSEMFEIGIGTYDLSEYFFHEVMLTLRACSG